MNDTASVRVVRWAMWLCLYGLLRMLQSLFDTIPFWTFHSYLFWLSTVYILGVTCWHINNLRSTKHVYNLPRGHSTIDPLGPFFGLTFFFPLISLCLNSLMPLYGVSECRCACHHVSGWVYRHHCTTWWACGARHLLHGLYAIPLIPPMLCDLTLLGPLGQDKTEICSKRGDWGQDLCWDWSFFGSPQASIWNEQQVQLKKKTVSCGKKKGNFIPSSTGSLKMSLSCHCLWSTYRARVAHTPVWMYEPWKSWTLKLSRPYNPDQWVGGPAQRLEARALKLQQASQASKPGDQATAFHNWNSGEGRSRFIWISIDQLSTLVQYLSNCLYPSWQNQKFILSRCLGCHQLVQVHQLNCWWACSKGFIGWRDFTKLCMAWILADVRSKSMMQCDRVEFGIWLMWWHHDLECG